MSATTFATISTGGVLTTKAVTSNQSVIVKASYTSLGVTKAATKTVAIVNVPGTRLRLNDTGIMGCGNGSQNKLPCPVTGYPEQDAQYGRDKTANNKSDGHAGFSFTKLDANGKPLAASATTWSCIRDNVTGRVWEEKTNDGGLRDKDWTYSWYNSNAATNGGDAGWEDFGSCTGSNCDTQAYVRAVNARVLCGARDWRLPTVGELVSIVNNDRTIHRFWSSSSTWFALGSMSAWYVDFGPGDVGDEPKINARYVRLVRGGQ